jgi:hypothetical protein
MVKNLSPFSMISVSVTWGGGLQLDASLQRGIEGVRLLTEKGLERAVSTWNQYRKSKLASIQEL